MVLVEQEILNADLENRWKKLEILEKKSNEIFLRLIKKQKREKEEVLKKILVLERQLDAKLKLELETEVLKGKLQVMKYLGDEGDTTVQEQIKKINDELVAKMEELDGMQEAAGKELIKKEKEEALKTAVELETEVDAKLKLEMGIAGLKAKL